MLITLVSIQAISTVSYIAYQVLNNKQNKLKCVEKTSNGFRHYKFY